MCRLVYIYDNRGYALRKAIDLIEILEDISGGYGFGYTDGKSVERYIGEAKQTDIDRDIKYTQILAMTRYSTVGKTNIDNQQPIEIKGYGYMVHNGTLYPHRYPEIGEERPKYDEHVIKNKLLWKDIEEKSDTTVIANAISKYISEGNTIEDYFRNIHPKDQTVMIISRDGEIYIHRGHNPLRYFANDRSLIINNLWGKDIDRGTYSVSKTIIKRIA